MNKKIYDEYKLDGFPNHFYTLKATDFYNNKIERWCAKLNPLATDLYFNQKVKRFLLIMYLDILDVIWAKNNSRTIN